jgi:homoserine O-acetyltransferase
LRRTDQASVDSVASAASASVASAAGASVSFVELESDKGHDAFLLEEPNLFATTRGFIGSAARARGI